VTVSSSISDRVVGIEHTNPPYGVQADTVPPQHAMTNDDIWVLQTSDEDDLLVSSQPPSQGGGQPSRVRRYNPAATLRCSFGESCKYHWKSRVLAIDTSVHYTTFGTPFQLMPFIDGSNTALS
jgi:hypothetical protein